MIKDLTYLARLRNDVIVTQFLLITCQLRDRSRICLNQSGDECYLLYLVNGCPFISTYYEQPDGLLKSWK